MLIYLRSGYIVIMYNNNLEYIKNMLLSYNCSTVAEYENALKEIIQYIALLGLTRTDFFDKAAFYGGTALRILYNINRYSEDLDFSLLERDKEFKLEHYNEYIYNELLNFGLESEVTTKSKNIKTDIKTTTMKANTKTQFVSIDVPKNLVNSVHRQKNILIKMEVDTCPPLNFNCESKSINIPSYFKVNAFTIEDNFAGKVSAILCRQWKTRVKGRDWYDFKWLMQRNVKLGFNHLKYRLHDSGYIENKEKFNLELLKEHLHQKVDNTDFDSAMQDIEIYILDKESLSVWNKDMFHILVDRITV